MNDKNNILKKVKLKGKRKKPLRDKVADYLIEKYDQNELLKQKTINKSVLDLF